MPEDVPMLIVDGQLKGQIRRVHDERLGFVNVEPVEPLPDDMFAALSAKYHHVRYRGTRINLFEDVVVVGWCGPTPEPAVADLVDALLSDAAKQLTRLATPLPEDRRDD